jgi:hypothetical protein
MDWNIRVLINSLKILKFFLYAIMLNFVLKNCLKYVIFIYFQVIIVQVLLLLKKIGYHALKVLSSFFIFIGLVLNLFTTFHDIL